MENGFDMNQKLVREVARLRKELLEVEEARRCAIDTIKYLETLHKKNGTDPLLPLHEGFLSLSIVHRQHVFLADPS